MIQVQIILVIVEWVLAIYHKIISVDVLVKEIREHKHLRSDLKESKK